MMTPEQTQKIIRGLTDKGLLIEAGWVGFFSQCYPQGCGDAQRDQMRNVFFSGAQHLFTSIVGMLESGTEPTDADLDRMTHIDGELKKFFEIWMLRNTPAEGRG